MIQRDQPRRGDIVICRYPRGGWQVSPRRPAVILDCIDEEKFRRVLVAFGTTQASGSSSRSLIGIVDPEKIRRFNLKYATWFDLRQAGSIPYTALSFDVNYRGTAIIGRLGEEELARIEAVLGDQDFTRGRIEKTPELSRFGIMMAVIRSLMQRRYPTG